MTKEERDFTKRQLEIIDKKIDDDSLYRYSALLSVSGLTEEVKNFLKRAVDQKKKELHPLSPMVVNGDLDDID